MLGGDNERVFKDVAGKTDEEYEALVANGHIAADYLAPDGTPL